MDIDIVKPLKRNPPMDNKLGIDRRAVIGGATLLAAAGINAEAQERTKMTSQMDMPPKTFVLVHGAWHGGWCWRRVADLLERKGHKVYTPTLTGLADRSHLFNDKINVTTHVTDIVNLVQWEGLDGFVLCGHSYGGCVISGVAEQIQPKIASIIYLDAFFPSSGESLVDAGGRSAEMVKALLDKQQFAIPPIPAATFHVNEKDRAYVDRLCTPQPIATFTEGIALTGARERVAKKTYVRAKAYDRPAFDAIAAKLAADASWKTYTLPCGHDAMLDMPEAVADILIERA
jgi:pimeloyl-ACP methyl ester carboxylesterase